MRSKRWATELNDEQIEWLKETVEAVKKTGDYKDFTGSILIQELIERARVEDQNKLITALGKRYLQRRVEALQAQLASLTGEKDGKVGKKVQTKILAQESS